MISAVRPTTARYPSRPISSRRSSSSTPTMDAPKQGVLQFKPRKDKENVLPPSALPRLSVKRDPNQPAIQPRRVSGSQPTLGAAALRTQVDTLRAENAKLRKEHLRELSKLQEKSSQSEARIQELVREKLSRENQSADAEREQRMTTQREAALRSALERSEAALKQLNERSGKLGGAERRLEDLERIHADEKRKHALELSSLQSQLDVARSTMSEQTARLRERDTSRRAESRARDLEARLHEREARVRDLEEELATAEAQAEVYESRVQVYDRRVRAYKERVRAAEERAREAEAENEALLAAQVDEERDGSKELERVKELLERMATAYGELYGRMKDKEREARGMEWVLAERGRRIEALEEALRLAQEETRDLVEEMDARQAERQIEDLEVQNDEGLDDPRAAINELLALVHYDKAELRTMELEKFKFLTQFSFEAQPPPPPPTAFSPLPSPPASPPPTTRHPSAVASMELELAQLRAECDALRAEQESLEQDLVDAAMDADEHARRAGEYARLKREYGALEAEVGRLRAVGGSWEGQGLQDELERVRAEVERLRTELERLQSESARLQAELAGSKAELVRSQSELDYSRAESSRSQGELVDTRTQLANSRTELARLETERTRLSEEFATYKLSMEDTARSAAEHEARAVLLNGSQAREHALRDQIEGLRAQIKKLEGELVQERASVKRAKERLDEARNVEEELREDIDEMMEALDRVDRYEEAYEMLVSEIVQLGLGEDELDRLQAMSEKTLGVSTAKQKMKYVEEVKVEMDNIADKLARAEWERDQARAEGMNLRRELSVFQTVTGLNGWTNASRSASTPPVRAPSTPLERIAESSAMSSSGMPTRAEMRALGLGLPSVGVPRPSSNAAPSERRISRALSFAMEAEGMTN